MRAVAEVKLIDEIIVCMNLFVREEGLFALLVACRNLLHLPLLLLQVLPLMIVSFLGMFNFLGQGDEPSGAVYSWTFWHIPLLFPLLLDLPLFLWVFHDGVLLIGGCGLFRHGQLYSNNEVDRSLDLDACKVLALGNENRGQG